LSFYSATNNKKPEGTAMETTDSTRLCFTKNVNKTTKLVLWVLEQKKKHGFW